MNYYSCPFRVGSHHYAYGFKKLGYDVAFLSKPLSPWHLLLAKNKERTDRYEIWKQGGLMQDGIWSYVPMSLATPNRAPLLRTRLCMETWQHLTYPNIVRLLRKQGFGKVKLIWFDNPVFGFLLHTIEHDRSILRIADYLRGFPDCWDALAEKEIEVASKVDRVIYTANSLKPKFAGLIDERKITFVPNGVDIDFFEKADKNFPEEFKDIPQPRITYVGAIDKWFDVNLLVSAARRLEQCSFVVIGLARMDVSPLKQVPNIHLLGPKPYNRVPQFLAHSQVGMIPFTRNELVEHVNPIKLYEYMACGLPVVSTSWQELKTMGSPAILAENESEFVAGLAQAMTQTNAADAYRIFAQNNSWQKRLETVLELI